MAKILKSANAHFYYHAFPSRSSFDCLGNFDKIFGLLMYTIIKFIIFHGIAQWKVRSDDKILRHI